jgi:hypothetical protein
MKNIEVHVHFRDGEPPRTIQIKEDATIESLLRLVSPDRHHNLRLLINDDDDEACQPHRTLHECGIHHNHHVHCHPHVIHYTVDTEAEETTKRKLTAVEIMSLAGVDTKTHYLILLKPGSGEESYQQNPQAEIRMHDGMEFLTASLCPATVS